MYTPTHSKAATPAKASTPSLMKDRTPALVTTFFVGSLFGLLLQKTTVHRNDVIRGQMNFSVWTMMVVFLAASAASTLAVAISRLLSPTKAYLGGKKHLESGIMGLPAIMLGTFLVGLGMTLSGACPGTVYAQLGGGNSNALVILAGGVIGATIHAVMYPALEPFLKRSIPTKRTLYEYIGVHPLISSVALAGIMLSVSFIVYFFLPTTPSDVVVDKTYTGLTGLLHMPHWNPILGGLTLGSLQVPLILLLGKSLGASTSFSVVASNTLLLGYKKSSYANAMRDRSAPGLFPVVIVLGIVSGAAFSAWMGSSWVHPGYESTGDLLRNFVGGIIMIFGARVASGCTSGHGITGVGYQAVSSLIGVACMFAGAMGSAFILGMQSRVFRFRYSR